MTRRFSQVALLFVVVFLGAIPSLAQGKRVALVIGNSEYKHTPRLENPKNDAVDMAATLKKLDFAVIEGRDLDKAAMDHTIRDFAEALTGAHTGLFFYAGHGLQVGGQNYLVPIDAKLTTASAVDFEMVRLDLVHRTMERETSTNIIIIDACRDNPLARNLARALGTRSTQIGRGFAPVESGEGTLISFSTQPGNVALDGTGRNSPYTTALLKHIATPGDDLPTILINVRNEVMQQTARRQVPWEHSAMTAKFYFIPPIALAQQLELAFWASVKDSENRAVLASYLDRYPNGTFAPLARALIEQHKQQQEAERATQEAELRRYNEARKEAELARLEAERKAAESRADELQKALEEVRIAREAAKAAEEQRAAAVKAAEKAHKAADAEAEKGPDRLKVAALPKPEQPKSANPFDGTWQMVRSGQSCRDNRYTPTLVIRNGTVIASMGAGGVRGSVSASGVFRLTHLSTGGAPGATHSYSGTLRGHSGSGTFHNSNGPCSGTFTLTRR
jgi:uncharacterized caspase-like protein